MMHKTFRNTGTAAFEQMFPESGLVTKACVIILGTLLLTASAKVQAPFWPVPMTMQTLAVLMIATTCGPLLAAATVGAYLLEGLAGLPVFAGPTAGPAYLVGPTAGYLAGFLATAVLAGWLSCHSWARTFWGAATVMLIGHVVIFAAGLLWLGLLIGYPKAVAVGFAPFIAGAIFKTFLGAVLTRLALRSLPVTSPR